MRGRKERGVKRKEGRGRREKREGRGEEERGRTITPLPFLSIQGVERFADYKGYGASLEFAGECSDQAEVRYILTWFCLSTYMYVQVYLFTD